MVQGSCPVCHPSGGVSLVLQILGWGSVELLQTSDVRAFFSECTLRPGLGSTRRFGYSMLCFSVALLPGVGVGCPLLSSRAL